MFNAWLAYHQQRKEDVAVTQKRHDMQEGLVVRGKALKDFAMMSDER